MICNTLYGNYRQRKFSDVFMTDTSFIAEYKQSGIYQSNEANRLSDENMSLLYYLLYAKYGNSVVAASDETRFKYQLWALIFSYGPAWIKKLELQDKLRALTDSDIFKGSETIFNYASHPGQSPDTATTNPLSGIDQQNRTIYQKGKVDGLANLYALLTEDVTSAFINRFKKLFLTVVIPERPLYYEEVEYDDDRANY